MKNMLKKFLTVPWVSIFLRRIVENNFKKEKELIKKYFSIINDQILDLGCGTGEFSVFFPPEKYIGIDIDLENIKYASSHYKGNFLVADAKNMLFPDNSFSNVLVIGVFHHLSDQDCQLVLAEIKRVLKPQGRLLIMEDTIDKNMLSKIINYFDQGKYIRKKEEWKRIFSELWHIEKESDFRAGICFYSAYLLKNK